MAPIDDESEDTTVYKVVINDEEQYSIWPQRKQSPPGWRDGGMAGSKAECLAHIGTVWTDMRPLSLRKAMAAAAAMPAAPAADETSLPAHEPLVTRLSRGRHRVEVSLRPERSLEALKQRIDLGHVHILFTDTMGGTELGVPLDRDASDLGGADFEKGCGVARLCGDLSLDFVRVRCVAEIDLASLAGTGRLEVL